MSEDEIDDVYWKNQLYISLWIPWLILIGIGFGLAHIVQFGIELFVGIPLFIVGITIIGAHIGLIADGRAIKKSDQYEWRPLWPLYFFASMLIGPYFIVPIYLYRRSRKTGRPNRHDVRKKFSIKGIFIPWY